MKMLGSTMRNWLACPTMPPLWNNPAMPPPEMYVAAAGEIALIAEKLNPQQSFALTHEAHTVIGTLPLLGDVRI